MRGHSTTLMPTESFRSAKEKLKALKAAVEAAGRQIASCQRFIDCYESFARELRAVVESEGPQSLFAGIGGQQLSLAANVSAQLAPLKGQTEKARLKHCRLSDFSNRLLRALKGLKSENQFWLVIVAELGTYFKSHSRDSQFDSSGFFQGGFSAIVVYLLNCLIDKAELVSEELRAAVSDFSVTGGAKGSPAREGLSELLSKKEEMSVVKRVDLNKLTDSNDFFNSPNRLKRRDRGSPSFGQLTFGGKQNKSASRALIAAHLSRQRDSVRASFRGDLAASRSVATKRLFASKEDSSEGGRFS